eukprot:1992322-Prorocentrum_lima.AAC.1
MVKGRQRTATLIDTDMSLDPGPARRHGEDTTHSRERLGRLDSCEQLRGLLHALYNACGDAKAKAFIPLERLPGASGTLYIATTPQNYITSQPAM